MRPTLKYSTLAESLAWLRLATGRDWTENELLDAATSRRITLHAAPPITANANLCELDLSRDAPAPFRVKCRLGWRMALLYPLHVAQIMHAGETETVHAAGEVQEPHEHIYFSEPFRAQREHVRVAQSALERLAAEFQAPTASVPTETAANDTDYDAELAALFDPVRRATLEALFPDGGKWKTHAERASRNGLIAARVERGKFNPYRAARWWMETQAPHGWRWERCARVLANSLPPRSRDCGHLLTGDLD